MPPVGSVVGKTFLVGDAPVETRLLYRGEDGVWSGFAWVWEGADARIVPADGATVATAEGPWSIPPRQACSDCHTLGAGGTLGLEHAQLDRTVRYDETGRDANQLVTFAHVGLLDEVTPSAVEPLAAPDGPEPVEDRARAYLHVNCSNCHRSSTGLGVLDTTHWLPLKYAGLCDPSQHGLGDLVVPGDPASSHLLDHMEVRDDPDAMPPIGTDRVDEAGVALLSEWIATLEDCP